MAPLRPSTNLSRPDIASMRHSLCSREREPRRRAHQHAVSLRIDHAKDRSPPQFPATSPSFERTLVTTTKAIATVLSHSSPVSVRGKNDPVTKNLRPSSPAWCPELSLLEIPQLHKDRLSLLSAASDLLDPRPRRRFPSFDSGSPLHDVRIPESNPKVLSEHASSPENQPDGRHPRRLSRPRTRGPAASISGSDSARWNSSSPPSSAPRPKARCFVQPSGFVPVSFLRAASLSRAPESTRRRSSAWIPPAILPPSCPSLEQRAEAHRTRK